MAQNAVHNYGTIQMHDNALVVFHGNLINDGIFYANLGLCGFYNTQNALTISGTSIPVFYDAEIMVDDGLYLDIGVGIRNNANFVKGNVMISRSDPLIYMNYANDAFYTGPDDPNKIDGYAGITNKESFEFPIGDLNRIRPLGIRSMAINPVASAAYFFEDPNSPSTFPMVFDTSLKVDADLTISTREFWQLTSTIPSQVTLSWDAMSQVSEFIDDISEIRVMGWNKALDLWFDLGNTSYTGDLNKGSVTSSEFLPVDYEIITLGGNKDNTPVNVINLRNFYLSPNSDGVNDTLIIENLFLSPNNTLRIYNRYGVMVYEMENYDNLFDGKSNVNMVIKQPDGLAAGIYFYTIQLKDLNEAHQGFMYISN
ncbi:MAG: gliding motility-associated C-terminal domain-containing protein [Bacteroidia bacterium]|nr:gliding motility-associated C-terminal domain-containing protein [Bacteroidia bacterium]